PAAPRPFLLSPSADTLDHQRLLDGAQAVGMRLEAFALHHEEYVTWMGLTPEQERFRVVPLSLDLYDGLPGVTLFLAYLGAVTGEQRYTRLAEKALFTVQSRLEDSLPLLTAVGAFNGWGGTVYLFTHLAALWNRPDLFAAADRVVERISE